MRPFAYARPQTVEETLALLDSHNRTTGNGTNGSDTNGTGGAGQETAPPAPEETPRLLAGGTDLITLMKPHLTNPAQLIDIKRLDDLPRGIHETPSGQNGERETSGPSVTLGALTTLTEIEQSALLQARYTALAQAAALAATPQLRNMATLGGNLLQRPRCWYFRQEVFHCWLKGGDQCHAYDGQNQHHALFGGGPCYAAHPSDLPAALLALDAGVRLRSQAGERTLSLADFYALPEPARRQETRIADDEIILSVHLPPQPNGARSLYLKAMDRKIWAFALVGVAAAMQVVDGQIAHVRLVLNGVAPIPWRVPAAEQILAGQAPSAALFDQAAEAALAEAKPLAHNGYKVPLARSLITRALTSLAGEHAAA